MTSLFEKALEIIQNFSTFLLTTHIKPDLDGTSGISAFISFLEKLDKKVLSVIESKPLSFELLANHSKILCLKHLPGSVSEFSPEVLIVFDTAVFSRIEETLRPFCEKVKKILVFDHHQNGEREETLSQIFPEKVISLSSPHHASTTELLYEFFLFSQKKLGKKLFDEAMANDLLTGIYFDTGGFKYDNVTEKTFKISGELTSLGGKPSLISLYLFENTPKESIEFLKIILERLEYLLDGKIAFSYITQKDIKAIGDETYLTGLPNFLRAISGVKVSALLKEGEKGRISCSLRSKPPVPVVEFASLFGGGGHKFASGFSIEPDKSFEEFMKEFKKKLIEYYEKFLKS